MISNTTSERPTGARGRSTRPSPAGGQPPIEEQFRRAIEQAGIPAPENIIADGTIHRFSTNGKSGDDAGWYVLFSDGVPAGSYGDWRSGIDGKWCSREESSLSAEERQEHRRRMADAQRLRTEEEHRRQLEVAVWSSDLWPTLAPAPDDHPYLQKKRVSANGLRIYRGDLGIRGLRVDGALVVPVRDVDGILWSFEFIVDTGKDQKRFLPGGKKKGCSHVLGAINESTEVAYIAEGYATGASVYQAGYSPVVIAFDARNLQPVAEVLHERYKNTRIVICGDNDESGHGQKAAGEAAQAVGGVVVLPETPGDDWNDVHVKDDLDAVKRGIEAAIAQADQKTEKMALDLSKAVVSYACLLALDLPERVRYLPWLPAAGNVMVYGPRGVGKTFFQLQIAASLVSGTDLWNWKTLEPVGVLYVDGEMNTRELRERITSIMPAPPKASLALLTGELVYQRCDGRDLILSSDIMRQEVIKILDAHPDIKVLILDNISCLFSGLNEDSKQDWEPINAWLIRLRHRGLTTVLVHHSGKSGQQRGTSGREDSLDTVVQLSLPAGYDPRDGCHFELHFTKCRSVQGDAVTPIDAHLQEINGRSLWTIKSVEVSKLDRARALLTEGVSGPSDLAEELGITKGYASKIIQKLKKEVS